MSRDMNDIKVDDVVTALFPDGEELVGKVAEIEDHPIDPYVKIKSHEGEFLGWTPISMVTKLPTI